jgi:hypothetical protein
MARLFTATALALAAMASPAFAGDNSCTGWVSIVGANGYIHGDIDGDGNEGHCTFSPASKTGKMIIAKCPVGTACHVQLPLEAKSHPITTTRIQVTRGRAALDYPGLPDTKREDMSPEYRMCYDQPKTTLEKLAKTNLGPEYADAAMTDAKNWVKTCKKLGIDILEKH